jgi:preprotein translocase subunit SecD
VAFTLSRIDRVPRVYTITATDENGAAVALTAIDFALTSPRARVSAATVWTPVTVTSGKAQIVLAGPDADPTGAFSVPEGGADLHQRWIDGAYVDAEFVERITVT